MNKDSASSQVAEHIRDYQICPHRQNVRVQDEFEWADCSLVPIVAGDELAAGRGEVRIDACKYCSQWAVPTPQDLNPMVASLLFNLSQELKADEKAIPSGRRHLAIKELESYALENLMEIDPDGDLESRQYEALPYEGECFHLGSLLGSRKCMSCRGNVTVKVFGCHHAMHEETTIRSCQRCPEYDPNLSTCKVENWVVAVTTAPRATPTLLQTVESLREAGWDTPEIFAEPDSPIPDQISQLPLTRRPKRMGAWGNWLLSLTELYLRNPHADAYFMCQDDSVFSPGLRAYLESKLWPTNRLGVVSLHTPSHQAEPEITGFFARDVGWGAWGAMGFVFPNASVRTLLSDPAVINHRQRGIGDGMQNVDSVIGHWCRRRHLGFFLHSPSLIQHTGETSTLWKNASLGGRRSSSDFPEIAGSLSEEMERRAADGGKPGPVEVPEAGITPASMPRSTGVAVAVFSDGRQFDNSCPAAESIDAQELLPDEYFLLTRSSPADLENGWKMGNVSGPGLGNAIAGLVQASVCPWLLFLETNHSLSPETMVELVPFLRATDERTGLVILSSFPACTDGESATINLPLAVRREVCTVLKRHKTVPTAQEMTTLLTKDGWSVVHWKSK